jgi:hypothetical protein
MSMTVHNPFGGLNVILLPPGRNPRHLFGVATVEYAQQNVTYAAFYAEFSAIPDGVNVEDLYSGAIVHNLFDEGEDNTEFEDEFTTPSPQDAAQNGTQGYTAATYSSQGHRFRFAADGLIFKYMGKTTLWLDSPDRGYDEIVDWCAINFLVGADGVLIGWRSQHLASRDTKASILRTLAMENAYSPFNVFIPAVAAGLEGCGFFSIEADAGAQVRCNIPVVRTFTGDGDAGEQPLTYPSRAIKITPLADTLVAAGGTIDLPLSVVWRKDGLPIGVPIELCVTSKQGYIPNRKLMVDANGNSTVRVMAYGMATGQRIKLKIGTEALTVLDRFPIDIEVV